MKGKKGIIFIVDVFLGFSIIVAGFLMLVSYYYDVPIASQSSFYSEDFLNFLITTEYEEFGNNLTRFWIDSDYVFAEESLGSSISRFCNESNVTSFERILNNSLNYIVPEQLDYSASVLFLNETSTACYFESGGVNRRDSSPVLSVSRGVIVSKNSDFEMIGPYILEVSVW